jgi:hypothetical protein
MSKSQPSADAPDGSSGPDASVSRRFSQSASISDAAVSGGKPQISASPPFAERQPPGLAEPDRSPLVPLLGHDEGAALRRGAGAPREKAGEPGLGVSVKHGETPVGVEMRCRSPRRA